ncbi:MAG: phosphoglucosamine mutase [bacterium]|nr:MAG: phosphoglucosamine mutase [bacterium]
MQLIISVSGARGIVGPGINPAAAARLATAFTRFVDKGLVVVGRDTRASGPLLADALFSTLRFNGIAVIDLGVSSTPTVELMVQELGADGGIVITASHNGPEWNALKFIGRDGEFLPAEAMKEIERIFHNEGPQMEVPGEFGGIARNEEADAVHIRKILELDCVDRELIASRGYRAAVDCVNGAGSRIIPALLHDLGVTVEELYTDIDAPFPHNPEPRPEHLWELSKAVSDLDADIGFACDQDADRLVLVDEQGVVCSEELTLALAADFVLEKAKGPVVANLSTSRLVDDVAGRRKVPVYRSKVGETNVVAVMREKGAVVGGEGNGGVIYPPLHYGRDAMVGIALILQSLAESGMSLGEKVGMLPTYHIRKEKLPFKGNFECVTKELQSAFKGRVNTLDGMRIDMEEGWIHVRRSNTEPVVRIIAETGSEDATRTIVARAGEILRSCNEATSG